MRLEGFERDVKAGVGQFSAVAVVALAGEAIVEDVLLAIGKQLARQRDASIRAAAAEVDDDQVGDFARARGIRAVGAGCPNQRDQRIVRTVPVTGGIDVGDRKRAGLEQRVAQRAQDVLVSNSDFGVFGFSRAPAQLHRQFDATAFELTFVHEAHARREQRHDRRTDRARRTERVGRALLVVILNKARALFLERHRTPQMLSDAMKIILQEAVIQNLVVGEVKTLRLQMGFLVPIRFGQKDEIGMTLGDHADRFLPKAAVDRIRPGPRAPCPLEDFRDDQHRHVAAHAVALRRDFVQRAEHGVAAGKLRVIDLGRVRPRREKGIATEGDDRAFGRLEKRIRSFGQILLGALDENLRLQIQQPVIAAGVVADKIQNQVQAFARHAFAQPRQRRRAAELRRDDVAGHRIRRTDAILDRVIRQRLVVFALQARRVARDFQRVRPGGPHAHQPDRVEAQFRDAVELLVGHRVQLHGLMQPRRQFAQPYACIDFVHQRVGGKRPRGNRHMR